MPNTEFIIVENCLRNNTKPDGNGDDIFAHSTCNTTCMPCYIPIQIVRGNI